MDELSETAFADAAYWQDVERSFASATGNAGVESPRRTRSSILAKTTKTRKQPASRLCQPVLSRFDYSSWLDGAVQSRAFAERLRHS